MASKLIFFCAGGHLGCHNIVISTCQEIEQKFQKEASSEMLQIKCIKGRNFSRFQVLYYLTVHNLKEN